MDKMQELIEIRDEILYGIEHKDFLHIKFQVNKLDNLMYKFNQKDE